MTFNQGDRVVHTGLHQIGPNRWRTAGRICTVVDRVPALGDPNEQFRYVVEDRDLKHARQRVAVPGRTLRKLDATDRTFLDVIGAPAPEVR